MIPHPVPVDMLCRHNPPESYGDCMRACLATLLALPAAKVPHIGEAEHWIRAARDFLHPLGLTIVVYDFPAVGDGPLPVILPPGIFLMLFGQNPNGVSHAIVGHVTEGAPGSFAVEQWHDPNPSREGIDPASLDGLALLVPLPAAGV